jgi:NADH-quinone oxidoreductase subunit G
MIFGNSGGVAEAVLRAAAELLAPEKKPGIRGTQLVFEEVRGLEGVKEATVSIAGNEVRMAVVSSLGAAAEVLRKIASGEAVYDIVEVMSCPGGCIGGAGQPSPSHLEVRKERTKALYDVDTMQMLRRSHDNPYVKALYDRYLGDVGGEAAHSALHTSYGTRRRIAGEDIRFSAEEIDGRLDVGVCVGTCCYLHGSYDLLRGLMDRVSQHGLTGKVDLHATFCFENCGHSPNIEIAGNVRSNVTVEEIDKVFQEEILARLVE